MDRSDERKDNRGGDVLGLGGSITPDSSKEPRAHASDEERSRRRNRMSEGADEMTPSATEGGNVHHGAGATGIDMGSSGEGTDVE